MHCLSSRFALLFVLSTAGWLGGCADEPASPVVAPEATSPTPSVGAGEAVASAERIDSDAASPEIPANLTAIGTEPFWSARIGGDSLTYVTPEDPEGTEVPIIREDSFEHVRLSGTLDGAPFVLEVTRNSCSDGMSDTSYPMVVSLQLGDDVRQGCAR